jgi:transcriptional regulator with XRE-family HTH domain
LEGTKNKKKETFLVFFRIMFIGGILMKKHKELKMAIGFRLAQMRKRLKYTQQKMGEIFGISRVYYTRQEIGSSFPSHHVLHKLGQRLNVSLDWLICGKGPMFYRDKAREQEAAEQENASGGGLKLSKEQRRLIEHMNRFPLLHHEVMAFYHRFMMEHRDLVDEEPENKT